VNCPTWGIRIDGPDVDLDLGGHLVRGSGVGVGIDLGPNAAGTITITNGTVQAFRDGIGTPTFTDDGAPNPDAHLGGDDLATSVAVRRVRVVRNARHGIVNRWGLLDVVDSRIDLNGSDAVRDNGVVIGASFGRFERNVVHANGGAALATGYESGQAGFTFRDNVIAANREGLFFAEFGAPAEIVGNVIDDNGYGVRFDSRACSAITGNHFRRNQGAAVTLFTLVPGTACPVSGNEFRENDVGVLALSLTSGFVISRNVFTRNRTAGIYVLDEGDASGARNVIEDNVLAFNGFASTTVDDAGRKVDDGIHITPQNFGTLRRNQARDNADLGIEAARIVDGGSNWAVRNGNPLQCRGVFCHR
jgi:hypothetical protein